MRAKVQIVSFGKQTISKCFGFRVLYLVSLNISFSISNYGDGSWEALYPKALPLG
jgi:hypothetical protein